MPTQTCRLSGEKFEITTRDQEYYAKLNLPEPTLSPIERQRRRFTFRNERNLFQGKCGLCGQKMFNMYHPDWGYPVYCKDCYWSDKWDALKNGQAFDFNRPFFEQFAELMKKVPRIPLYAINAQNSDYCNYVGDVKNCYLVFGSVYAEDCYYGSPYYSKSCVDSLVLRKCELCYECTDCRDLYQCLYCQDCNTSNDLAFCYDLQGCSECIGCVGLRNQKFHVFNKAYSESQYRDFKKSLDFCNPAKIAAIRQKMQAIKLQIPHKFMQSKQTENVSGNYVFQSKNTLDSYYADRCEDCSYCAQVVDLKDCYDNNYTEENELCYDYIGMYKNNRALFSSFGYQVHDSFYADGCKSAGHLFGCISVRDKKHCILNKQYSQAEYEELLPKIITHLQKTQEWGEFWPSEISPFPYNFTVAHEYFPLTKAEAQKRNYKWQDPDPKEYQPQTYQTPANIKDVPDEITQELLACTDCGKNYKIVPQELAFYRQLHLPIPQKCPNCRHQARLNLRNPRRLWPRECQKCQAPIQTSYSPDRPEKVYCEKCYLEEMY